MTTGKLNPGLRPWATGIGPRARRVLLLALMGAGCAGSDPLAPFEPEIGNLTDTFQLQASDVRGVTATFDYTWRNTGTLANVNHSTTTTGGSTRLIIRDADNNPVYDRSLAASLNEPTLAGSPGDWSIRLVLTDFSGTLNVRVQKP